MAIYGLAAPPPYFFIPKNFKNFLKKGCTISQKEYNIGVGGKGVQMGNIERLLQNKVDSVLASFCADRGANALVENATFNRGDFFEMAITGEQVKRNGLHEVSKGDYIYNGEIVEIKYLTKKTGASKDLKGTTAQKYLIGFNSGKEIILKLIDKKDLKTRVDGKRLKITYQDNIGLGVRVK